jgi:hypothetical protein
VLGAAAERRGAADDTARRFFLLGGVCGEEDKTHERRERGVEYWIVEGNSNRA